MRRKQTPPAESISAAAFRGAKKDDATAGLSETRFRHMFRLITTAITHEVGGGIGFLGLLCDQAGREVPAAGKAFMRIQILSTACMEGTSRGWDMDADFSEDERSAAGIAVSEKRLRVTDPDRMRRTCLQEVANLRRDVVELVSAATGIDSVAVFGTELARAETETHLRRLPHYTAMLCDCLERLMNGDTDFAEDYVSEEAYDDKKRLGVLLILQSYFNGRGIDSDCTASIEDNLKVRYHPIFMALIIENIYSNARRAMEGIDDKRVTLSATAAGGKVAFRITDNGCGMDAETMEKLNSGMRVTSKPEDGEEHGLGFRYCRELALKMGGALYVEESRPGKTTVVLELRLAE